MKRKFWVYWRIDAIDGESPACTFLHTIEAWDVAAAVVQWEAANGPAPRRKGNPRIVAIYFANPDAFA